MLRRASLVRTDVSEERIATFIIVTRIGELDPLKLSGHDPRTLGDAVPHS
jgi:hypothetical protein